jgi:superfamily II DNA or RNA helicase
VLVPTVDLVHQLKDDFVDYNAPKDFINEVQQIGGEFNNKNVLRPIVISTYQSAIKSDLSGFDVIINDEAHLAKAETIQTILQNPFKIKLGLTGSPPPEKLDLLLLEQHYGQPKTYITAKGLIDLGLATDVVISAVFLKQKQKIMKYHEEVKFIKDSPKRRKWITGFMKKLKGLSIGLYQHTEHGEQTWEDLTGVEATAQNLNNFELQKKLGVFFLKGGTKTSTRKRILNYIKNLNGTEKVILIGQIKLLSTGINIKPLKHLVFLSSTKGYVTVIQSIGRVLRLHDSKKKAVIWDLVDDFSSKRKTENYALKHFWERLSFYEFQQFDIIETEVQL